MLKMTLTDRVRVPVEITIPTDGEPITGSITVYVRRQDVDTLTEVAQQMLVDIDAKRQWLRDIIVEVVDLVDDSGNAVATDAAVRWITSDAAPLDQVSAAIFPALRGVVAKNSARRR